MTRVRTVQAEDMMGATEVAAYLGVSRQRVLELRQTNPQFPEPARRLSAGPIWDRKDIQAFVDQWDRKPGRPRKDHSKDHAEGELTDLVPTQPTAASIKEENLDEPLREDKE